jgi:hypothetical protein
MPALANANADDIADIVAEAITELTASASLLEQKQPGRHAARMVTTVNFNVEQLASVLPALREMTRPPKG